jgi:hypothetical protein
MLCERNNGHTRDTLFDETDQRVTNKRGGMAPCPCHRHTQACLEFGGQHRACSGERRTTADRFITATELAHELRRRWATSSDANGEFLQFIEIFDRSVGYEKNPIDHLSPAIRRIVNVVDDRTHDVHRRFRKHPVPKVEHVTQAPGRLVENPLRVADGDVTGREQRAWVEITLDGPTAPNSRPSIG